MPDVNAQITACATRRQKAERVKDIRASPVRHPSKKPEHLHIVIQETLEESRGDAGQLTNDGKRGGAE